MGRMGNCNFDGLKELQKKLNELQKEQTKFMEACAKELTARLLAMCIKNTPVGVKPKHLTKAKKTVKVKGASGKQYTMLSREGSILDQYWAGYVGGTLRRGWTAKTSQEAKNGNGKTTTNAQVNNYVDSLRILHSQHVYKIEVTNPVEYASYVEYGHRQQKGRYVPQIGRKLVKGWVPGKFMLTISEQDLQVIAPRLLEEKITKLMGEKFK